MHIVSGLLYDAVPQPGAAEHHGGSSGARRRVSRAKGCCRRLLEPSTTGTDAVTLATVTFPKLARYSTVLYCSTVLYIVPET